MATMAEANRAMKKLPDLANVAAQQVMDVTAFQFARMAEARVKRRTGFLASRLTWQSRPRSVSAVVGVNDPRAYYWKFLEYGTVKMDAQPFLRPAAVALEADHDRRMEEALLKVDRQLEAMAR